MIRSLQRLVRLFTRGRVEDAKPYWEIFVRVTLPTATIGSYVHTATIPPGTYLMSVDHATRQFTMSRHGATPTDSWYEEPTTLPGGLHP